MRFSDTIENRLTGRHKKSFVFVGHDNIKNKNILDIGCSYGWFEKWALESGCKEIVGIEPDKNNYENGQKEVPAATFVKGSAFEIPLKDKSVDIVVMWEVLEHLPRRLEENVFFEIRRVLKANGELYLSTPNKTVLSCVLDPAWWLVGHRHYSLAQFKKIGRKTGFKIAQVEYGGGFWELNSMILLYLFKWLFRREIPLKSWFDKKRDEEFLSDYGWTNIFIKFTVLNEN